MHDHDPEHRTGTPGEPGVTAAATMSLDTWAHALAIELGIDVSTLDIPALLDLAGEGAHLAGRPGGPVTAFLVGYAAGARGESLTDVVDRASEITRRWDARPTDERA